MTSRPALLAAPLLAPLFMAFVAGCTGEDSPSPPNIVLFTVDTLRADAVGAYGNQRPEGSPTPLADRLASQGVLFENCYVPRGQTHPSLASLLTGKFPITHGLRQNGDDLPLQNVPLPVMLKKANYRTAGFCSNLDITRWPFWIRGLDIAEDGVEGRLNEEGYENSFLNQQVWDERTVEKAIRWIDTLPPDDDRPFFLWVHLYDVHQPYTPSEKNTRRYQDPKYQGPLQHPSIGEDGKPENRISPLINQHTLGQATLDEQDLRQVRNLYDAGVRDCDENLERVYEALSQHNLLDNTMVIYSSDHGEELANHHGYFGHGNSIYDSVLQVPLVISWPGNFREGHRVSGLCQNIDLMPTILDAAGIDTPFDVEGRSLIPVSKGEERSTDRGAVFAEWEDLLYSVRTDEWKYIHNPDGSRPRKPPYQQVDGAAFPYDCYELYRVDDDPSESENRYVLDRDVVDTMRSRLKTFLSLPEHRQPMRLIRRADSELDPLGYVGSGEKRNIEHIDCGDE